MGQLKVSSNKYRVPPSCLIQFSSHMEKMFLKCLGKDIRLSTRRWSALFAKKLIKTAYDLGFDFPIASRRISPEFEQMGTAMAKVLQACPEFMNKWCYQDLGGSQKLRGPCPDHLVCHYCLGLNPLMCV